MESYERMEQDMCEFKKYIKMTNDLLCDSKKWDILSKYSENIEDNIETEHEKMFTEQGINIKALIAQKTNY